LLWAGAALVLTLPWELARLHFYAFAATVGPLQLACNVAHCTVGDVLIARASFTAAALILRDAHWPMRRPWPGPAMADPARADLAPCALGRTRPTRPERRAST
jgi:hypothetical protein